MIDCSLPSDDDPLKQIEACIKIMKCIGESPGVSVELDMSGISWVVPCSAILLSNVMDRLSKKGIFFSYRNPTENKVIKYLTSIGFPFGKQGIGSTYCPVHHFSTDIDKEMNQVLEIVDNNFPQTSTGAIKYILSELADNVSEHSKFTHATIMAQFFDRKGFIDIGIVDNGISIPRLFEINNIVFESDANAIELAISGTSTKGQDRGFGLPTTKNIVEKGLEGEFYILSRNGGIYIKKGSQSKLFKVESNSVFGTFVYIRFKKPQQKLNINQWTSTK